MGWPEHRLPHRVLSMGPLHGILMESPGKKSSVLSKARCSSGVVDTQAYHPQKRTNKKKRECPLLYVQGSRRTACHVLIPTFPPALDQWSLQIHSLHLDRASALGWKNQRHQFSEAFPSSSSLGSKTKGRGRRLHFVATVVRKKDSSLQNTGPSLCPYEFLI